MRVPQNVNDINRDRSEPQTDQAQPIPLRFTSLVEIVKETQSRGLQVGHTLMQKLTYLLQSALRIPLGYSFRIHYYGPYSDEVWQDLRILDDLRILSVTPQEDGYGYSITLGENSKSFERHESGIPKEAIKEMVKILGGSGVKTLEIVATTHYAYTFLAFRGLEKSKLDEESTRAVISLKPHINAIQVSEALEILKKLSWV